MVVNGAKQLRSQAFQTFISCQEGFKTLLPVMAGQTTQTGSHWCPHQGPPGVGDVTESRLRVRQPAASAIMMTSTLNPTLCLLPVTPLHQQMRYAEGVHPVIVEHPAHGWRG